MHALPPNVFLRLLLHHIKCIFLSHRAISTHHQVRWNLVSALLLLPNLLQLMLSFPQKTEPNFAGFLCKFTHSSKCIGFTWSHQSWCVLCKQSIAKALQEAFQMCIGRNSTNLSKLSLMYFGVVTKDSFHFYMHVPHTVPKRLSENDWFEMASYFDSYRTQLSSESWGHISNF